MNRENTDLHDQIEDFLDGKLSEKEKIQFLKLLETDKELETLYHQRLELAENWVKAKKYEGTRNIVSELIREEKSKQRNRLYVWSIAASFLILVSISGIVMFTGQSEKQSNLANNSKGAENPMVPKIKQADEKAKMHIMGKVKLISPIRDEIYSKLDSIIFKWETDADAETYLIIGSQKDGNTIYREKIKLSEKQYVLEKNFLPSGKYFWAIAGFPVKEKFSIYDK
jgi:peptide subunit release factor 1 (eRF1)